MKLSYLMTALIFTVGLGSLIFGVTSSEGVTLLGVHFHPRIGKEIGIMAMIASVIVFLTAFSSDQPPIRTERPQPTAHASGNEHAGGEDADESYQHSPRV